AALWLRGAKPRPTEKPTLAGGPGLTRVVQVYRAISKRSARCRVPGQLGVWLTRQRARRRAALGALLAGCEASRPGSSGDHPDKRGRQQLRLKERPPCGGPSESGRERWKSAEQKVRRQGRLLKQRPRESVAPTPTPILP